MIKAFRALHYWLRDNNLSPFAYTIVILCNGKESERRLRTAVQRELDPQLKIKDDLTYGVIKLFGINIRIEL